MLSFVWILLDLFRRNHYGESVRSMLWSSTITTFVWSSTSTTVETKTLETTAILELQQHLYLYKPRVFWKRFPLYSGIYWYCSLKECSSRGPFSWNQLLFTHRVRIYYARWVYAKLLYWLLTNQKHHSSHSISN